MSKQNQEIKTNKSKVSKTKIGVLSTTSLLAAGSYVNASADTVEKPVDSVSEQTMATIASSTNQKINDAQMPIVIEQTTEENQKQEAVESASTPTYSFADNQIANSHLWSNVGVVNTTSPTTFSYDPDNNIYQTSDGKTIGYFAINSVSGIDSIYQSNNSSTTGVLTPDTDITKYYQKGTVFVADATQEVTIDGQSTTFYHATLDGSSWYWINANADLIQNDSIDNISESKLSSLISSTNQKVNDAQIPLINPIKAISDIVEPDPDFQMPEESQPIEEQEVGIAPAYSFPSSYVANNALWENIGTVKTTSPTLFKADPVNEIFKTNSGRAVRYLAVNAEYYYNVYSSANSSTIGSLKSMNTNNLSSYGRGTVYAADASQEVFINGQSHMFYHVTPNNSEWYWVDSQALTNYGAPSLYANAFNAAGQVVYQIDPSSRYAKEYQQAINNWNAKIPGLFVKANNSDYWGASNATLKLTSGPAVFSLLAPTVAAITWSGSSFGYLEKIVDNYILRIPTVVGTDDLSIDLMFFTYYFVLNPLEVVANFWSNLFFGVNWFYPNSNYLNANHITKILEHEIGHALGLAHTNNFSARANDMMNSGVAPNTEITKQSIDFVKLMRSLGDYREAKGNYSALYYNLWSLYVKYVV